jgi:hypothetical protein
MLMMENSQRQGSRITVQGLEDVRDSQFNGEVGTIIAERNGRWVVRCPRCHMYTHTDGS